MTPVVRLLSASVPLPDAFSLSDSVRLGPGILDQGTTESCVGHAVVGAIETRLAAEGTPVSHHSPICVYDLARCIDRLPIAGQFLRLVDTGSQPNQAVRGIQEWGVCSYADRPTDPTTINAEPTLDELEGASQFQLEGAYRIDSQGIERINTVKAALAQGYPVCFAIDVDDAFESYDGKGLLTAPMDSIGGHYLYACGYQTDTMGRNVIEFANSWGKSWGRGGFGYGDEPFLRNARDLYVMKVSKV